MKTLRLPKLWAAKPSAGRHRAEGRAKRATTGRHRATSAKDATRTQQAGQTVIPPWSQRKNYQGPITPPPSRSASTTRRQHAPAPRQTPADDRWTFSGAFFRK